MLWSERIHPAALPRPTCAADPRINTSPSLAGDKLLDIEELRTRLRKMTDAQLIALGKSAAFACQASSPREVCVILLEESQSEWRRRKATLLGATAE